LKPLHARLVKLGLIQTEGTLVLTDEADGFFEKEEAQPSAPVFQRQPLQSG